MEQTRLQHAWVHANCYVFHTVSHHIHFNIGNEWLPVGNKLRRLGTHCCRFGSDSCVMRGAANVWSARGSAMLFVFRTLNFFALGAIFLTPFWMFNNTLDRLLPHAPPVLSLRTDATTARLRDQLVTGLSNVKKDIRADMCRRDAGAVCLLTICVPRVLENRCR
jgi:hypothetical protein